MFDTLRTFLVKCRKGRRAAAIAPPVSLALLLPRWMPGDRETAHELRVGSLMPWVLPGGIAHEQKAGVVPPEESTLEAEWTQPRSLP